MTAESLTNGVIMIAGGALAWALWHASRGRAVFSIRVVDGQPHVIEGTITPAFLQRIREAAAAHAIVDGRIDGLAHGTLIRLKFSAEFHEAARQQLRNWWATFGWAPPRTGPAANLRRR